MAAFLKLILGLYLLTPGQASGVAGSVLGIDGDRLVRICHRESRCRRIGVHEIDAWLGARAYREARDNQDLPDTCPWYRERGRARRWATRGSWGTVAAYTVHEIGCWPPEILDIPIFGSLAAGLRLRRAMRGKALPATNRWAGISKPRK